MIELPPVCLGGLWGAAPCVGMWAPLALALGLSHSRLRENLPRQLIFSVGRILTYGFGGAAAAFGAWWLSRGPNSMVNVQAALSIVAGIALLLLGMSTAGLLPPISNRWLSSAPCTAARGLKSLLTSGSLVAALVAGVFTGFIPCGLVYAFLAYAASTGDVVRGWLTMATFGLGTVPLMVLAGSGGTLLSVTARTRALRIAAWCVMITGLMSIARGAGYIGFTAGDAIAGCPLCK